MNVYPQGMEKTVTYVKERYNNTPIFITENGKQRVHMVINTKMQMDLLFFSWTCFL